MKLDEYQQTAAFQNNPYSIIIAGAGTGKTYTLLGRIEYLINLKGFNPKEILVISFTNETVNEFRKKAKQVLGLDIQVYTFHKLALNILKQINYEFSLIDDYYLTFLAKEFLSCHCNYNLILKKYLKRIFSKFGFISYNELLKSKKFEDLQIELIKFVQLWNTKGINVQNFKHYFKIVKRKEKYFLILCFIFYNLYESEKSSQHFLDFDDLINKATFHLKKLQNFQFKHILVDEFQDSSYNRILFLTNLVNSFNMEFTVVGDDCQSIYRFSGTESNCFNILNSFFPSLKTFFLKNTYRNSQELINIANKFILKNPLQIKKSICSFKHLDKPIEILFYHKKHNIFRIINYLISKNITTNILFLGRYSFDWKEYFDKNEIQWIDHKHFKLYHFPGYEFTFLTIHESKGLEFDNVIILNVNNAIYGFPSHLRNSKFTNFFDHKDSIPYEEERRLFYVAMTRSKNYVFILSSYFSPSPFILELLRDNLYFISKKFF